MSEGFRAWQEQLAPLRHQHEVLQARLQESERLYVEKQEDVGQAKTRIEWEPQVSEALEALQQEEHQRQVGAFEQMLSAALQDVLPGERAVVMDLYSKNGKPALDVYLRKSGGPLEDALHGTGGSVTNVLSAGLRIITLWRSGARPFLILDEADCWIRPDLAPRFLGMIQEVANNLGIQVLMISHHNQAEFRDLAHHRLHLRKNEEGVLIAEWDSKQFSPVWEDDQPGLRAVLLEHCQAHTQTFLPLSPGLTLLYGENDLGKSAISTVFRAAFYADSNETIIQHGQRTAKATFDFGPQGMLSWQRHNKGKTTVEYRHFRIEHGEEVVVDHYAGARETPPWMMPTFGMGLIDGMDVQIGQQKQPIFLLDQDPNTRARALAVGSEAGYVQAMMTLGRQALNDARATVRQGEKQLEQAYRVIQTLKGLAPVTEGLKGLERLTDAQGEAEREGQTLRALLVHWQQVRARRLALAEVQRRPRVTAPTLVQTLPRSLVDRWRQARSHRQALSPLVAHARATPPTPPQAGVLKRLGAQWRHSAQRQQALAPLALHGQVSAPSAPSPSLAGLAQRWAKAQRLQHLRARLPERLPLPVFTGGAQGASLAQRWAHVQQQQRQRRDTQARLRTALAQLEAQWPEVCPTCAQPLPHLHSQGS